LRGNAAAEVQKRPAKPDRHSNDLNALAQEDWPIRIGS